MAKKVSQNNNVEMIRKITMKDVCGPIKQAPEGLLMTVIGIARDTKTGESNFGEWTALLGDFMATNAQGESFRSSKCILPEVAQELIIPAILTNEGQGVEFAFEIGKKADDSVAVGYVYTCRPLKPASENDPLAQLAESVGQTKMLGAG